MRVPWSQGAPGRISAAGPGRQEVHPDARRVYPRHVWAPRLMGAADGDRLAPGPGGLPGAALWRRAAGLHLSRPVVALMALAAATNLLGYGRDVLLAAWYGASPQTDAFFVGSFLPLLVQQTVVFGSLVPAFLPVLVHTGAAGTAGAPARARLVRAMAGLALALGVALAAGLALAAPGIIALIAPGFAPPTAAAAVTVLRLSAPLVLAVAPAGVLGAALNAQGRFVAPGIALALTNTGIVAALLLAGRDGGIAAAAAGMSAGGCAGLLVVVAAWRRVPAAAAPGADPPAEALGPRLARVGTLALPLLATVGLGQAVPVAERYLASQLPGGSLSLLAYAMKLNLLPTTILAGSLTTVLFPALSRESRAAAAGAPAFARALARGISQVLTWTVPAAAWLIVCATPVLRLLYERGRFGPADTAAVARLLALYAAGLVPLALLQLLPRAFHARQDMLRPLALHGAALLAYLALALLLAPAAGAPGLAAAFAAYAWVALGLFAWALRRDLRGVAAPLRFAAARACAATAVMAIVCFAVGQAGGTWLGDGTVAHLALVATLAAAGGGAYAATVMLLSGGRGAPLVPVATPDAE